MRSLISQKACWAWYCLLILSAMVVGDEGAFAVTSVHEKGFLHNWQDQVNVPGNKVKFVFPKLFSSAKGVGGAAAPIQSGGPVGDTLTTMNTVTVHSPHYDGFHFVFGMGQGTLDAVEGFFCLISRSDGAGPLGREGEGNVLRIHKRTAEAHFDTYSISLMGAWPGTIAEVTYTFACQADTGNTVEINESNMNVIVVKQDFTVPDEP
ncbi:MAG: hypothetical protein JSU59_02450 [Nitrospirota bacterium]|nr:MAG: hypothetical protein JSU59_02450 [Nitrospirota bacterium]